MLKGFKIVIKAIVKQMRCLLFHYYFLKMVVFEHWKPNINRGSKAAVMSLHEMQLNFDAPTIRFTVYNHSYHRTIKSLLS